MKSKKNEYPMERLKSIQRVDAPADLYNKVLQSIAKQKDVVPMVYVRTIAATVALFVTASIYIGISTQKSSSNSEDLSQLVSQTNYQLYNE